MTLSVDEALLLLFDAPLPDLLDSSPSPLAVVESLFRLLLLWSLAAAAAAASVPGRRSPRPLGIALCRPTQPPCGGDDS